MRGLAKLTRLDGSKSSVSRVSEELKNLKNEWVHFACHNIPNVENPFQSAFALRDGPFTIEHIMRCELEHPEFAYLSACQTTVGYKESPDEVIHLASAMQFAGFRSVIGTMWAVDDIQASTITSKFYEHMLDGCSRLDHTRAALALQRTMDSLADSVPLDQRILYVHIGA
jgi:CHAT domain-containing protein